MNSNPLISVIIPSYNAAEFLPEAIESALSQTYDNIEIIIVNDGSTDNTDEIITKYLDKISYIVQTNAGPAAARNKGIAHARGEYVAFLDADDIWEPDKTLMQCSILNTRIDVALVYGQIENFSDETGEKLYIEPHETPSGHLFDKILIKNFIALPSVMVRKSVLVDVGLFDEDLLTAEDTNLWLKISYKYQIEAIHRILVKRRIHLRNISNRVDIDIGTLENLDKIVRRYPEIGPGRYIPMHNAYVLRGAAMAANLFYNGNYNKCHSVCLKLISLHIINMTVVIYYAITLLPEPIIGFGRKLIRFVRR